MSESLTTYEDLEARISAWAPAQPAVRAVLSCGSRARGEADQWSDLDVLILTTDRAAYAADPGWLRAFGDLWLAYMEPTEPGDAEWYALYAGGLKVDAVLIQIEDPSLDLAALMQPLPYQGVFRRGVNVLFDRLGTPHSLPPKPFIPSDPPTAAAFAQAVNGFLLASATTAKFVARGDFWRAHNWFANDLRVHLLSMIRWHAYGKDTWYGGRFMEQWADPRVLAALPGAFATFDRDSLSRALLSMLDLMRWLGEETAARFGYTYPAEAHERVAVLVNTTMIER